jgi:hypothetical protein
VRFLRSFKRTYVCPFTVDNFVLLVETSLQSWILTWRLIHNATIVTLTNVREHNNAILGEVDVSFQSMRSDLNGATKGSHGILGIFRPVSSMCNSLWQLEAILQLPNLCKGSFVPMSAMMNAGRSEHSRT